MSEEIKNNIPEDTQSANAAPKDSGGKEETAGKKRRRLIRPTWLRVTLKTLMWIFVVLLLVPVLLYVPPVQTLVKNIACNVVYKSTGMKITVDKFRLKWPADVSLQGVTVIEASGDTMVNAKEVIADVKLRPLLNLDVDINRLRLIEGYYRMVSPDSSMILKVRAGMLEVDDKSFANIAESEINLNKASLKDGSLSLYMNVWKQQSTLPDSTSAPFLIKANDLKLENFNFNMSMLPTIDTLMLSTRNIVIRKGVVDLRKNIVTASYLGTSDGEVTYLTPTPEYIADHPAPAPDTTKVATPPMVIKGDTVALDRFKAVYAVKDAKPLPGFDPSYIEVSDVAVALNDFYNAASTVILPISRIEAKERSGLQIVKGSGRVNVDSTGLALHDLNVKTLYSDLTASAAVPFALMEMKPQAIVNAVAKGIIGFPDVEAFMPVLKTYTSKLPKRSPLNFDLYAEGTLEDVVIPRLKAAIPGVFAIDASGSARNALDFKKLQAELDFDGSVTNPGVVDNLLGNVGFKMPSLSLKGRATAESQNYAANFNLLSSAGDLAADGKVGMTSENYYANLNLHNVNVAHFMPSLGIGKVTASVEARGRGFNPTKPSAGTDVKLDVNSLVYHKQTLRDIVADVSLKDGVYNVNALSGNPDAKFRLDGTGTLAPDLYTFDITAWLDNIDLYALGLTPEANHGKGEIYITGSASPEKWIYDADLKLNNFEWTSGNQYFSLPGALTADLKSAADMVAARIDADRTSVEFNSGAGIQSWMKAFTEVSDSVALQIARRDLNVEGLQKAIPSFSLDVNASGRGLVGQYLRTMGMSMDTIYANVANDSLLRGEIGAVEIANGSTRADTITFDFKQRGRLLGYHAHMGNRQNNPIGDFADVNVNGYVGSNRMLVSLTQKNQKGETGYRLGMTGAFLDSIVTVHFTPLKATIAYLPWQLNDDNHVDFNFKNKHINANLEARSNESGILLQTQLGKAGNDELHVVLDNIRIQDFLRMSVFAPPLTASVDADLNVGYTQSWIYGGGSIDVSDFTYDKLRVGDFSLGLKAGRNDDGSTGARATLNVDGHDALLAKMMLVPDSVTKALTAKTMSVELTRFPLYIANAFLGADVAKLSGYLNGKMAMTGNLSEPLLNGSLGCDSVGVFVPMIGSSLTFGNDSITVADNILRFNGFDIWGANNNPIVLNGSVNAEKFSDVSFDLNLKAEDFQLVNNDKKSRSDVYGKVFFDLDATAKGPMAHFSINGNLNVLSNTDVTYSIPATTAALAQQDMDGVVKFVNFNDTAQIVKVDTVAPAMSMRIVAGLTIEPGTQVSVLYPGSNTTGSANVSLSPSGTLNYFQNFMGDMKLNGQLYLGNGSATYKMPMMAGSKKFTFKPESNVSWSGDIMNPKLNISATDVIKTNLLENGNSRLVNFNVILNVTNTLSSPKVLFDLSTEDDMSVENDLMSMSPDQRSAAAMNLLITGQYSGQGVKTASSDLIQGTLYNVLTSGVNSFLANHVKGVDLSFGVNQYDKTVNGQTGSTTSYSYTMSKSLFDNRFKISVGGNYTTDASADENFSENLISDISFEYILKQTSSVTMYARLFRHTGYESILEGEITETGVGFVMKRRLSDLRQLFNFKSRDPKNDSEDNKNPSDTTGHRKEDRSALLRKEEGVKPDSISIKQQEENYEK